MIMLNARLQTQEMMHAGSVCAHVKALQLRFCPVCFAVRLHGGVDFLSLPAPAHEYVLKELRASASPYDDYFSSLAQSCKQLKAVCGGFPQQATVTAFTDHGLTQAAASADPEAAADTDRKAWWELGSLTLVLVSSCRDQYTDKTSALLERLLASAKTATARLGIAPPLSVLSVSSGLWQPEQLQLVVQTFPYIRRWEFHLPLPSVDTASDWTRNTVKEKQLEYIPCLKELKGLTGLLLDSFVGQDARLQGLLPTTLVSLALCTQSEDKDPSNLTDAPAAAAGAVPEPTPAHAGGRPPGDTHWCHPPGAGGGVHHTGAVQHHWPAAGAPPGVPDL
jgi:hypothetical protein